MSEQYDDTRPITIEAQLAYARTSADAWRERWIAEAEVNKALLEACRAALEYVRNNAGDSFDLPGEAVEEQLRAAIKLAEGK